MILYTIFQVLETGQTWKSVQFEAESIRDIRQCVAAGWLYGQPRWATVDGVIVAAIDEKGRQLTREESAKYKDLEI